MSDIQRQIMRTADLLRRDPHIDIDALTYWVEQHEFDEIADELANIISNFLPGEPLPTRNLKILGLDVRARRRAP